MFRVLSLVLLLVVLVFGLSFAVLNAEPVQLNFYFGTREVPLSLILVITLVLGVLVGLSAMLAKTLKLRRQISKLRRDVRQSEKEVTNLRSLPLKNEL